jgi:DNA polymerase-3 subunit alpha
MPHAEFVHLRVHSPYSLSEGALKFAELVSLCRHNAMPAVALTDTNNLFGAMEFTAACRDAGIQPIVGCQLALAAERETRPGQAAARDSIVLLAQNAAGYANLMQLSSRAYLGAGAGQPPHIDWTALGRHADGLILLTGGAGGPIGRLLLAGQRPAARDTLTRLADLFAGRIYVELSRVGTDEERRTEDDFLALADDLALPLVATNEAFFGSADKFDAHDALLCIAGGTVVAERERRRLSPENRFRTAEEMRARFADLPEAIENTLAIARRCAVAAEGRKPILPRFPTPAGIGEAEQLRADATAGLAARLARYVFRPDMDAATRDGIAAPYRDRLAYELGVIGNMGFPGYFLIVADFIRWAKENGIPVGPGRGSGAASVVAWSLGITDLDPLRWTLLFERFLNPERVSMPDFDIDFCQDRRDEVIAYVRAKYGADRVAQIITFGKLQARAALRDVGRVLQMPYGQVDRICKLVPNNPAAPVSLRQAIEGEPLLQEMRRNDETVAQLMDIALKLEGLYRHASTHAAGVVIGDRPLGELIPLYRDPKSGALVTQFNMKDVEKAGLVKFDFLGLTTLSLLAHAVDLIAKRGVTIDLLGLPLDDAPTYAMLGGGDTVGVFQLESGGMRNALFGLKPDRFEDLIAAVALYRPGPMDSIQVFVNRKHGRERIDYLHPLLEPVLKETYGVITTQEQVMQIAQVLAGYSLGGADLLRRAMGKKIKSEMDDQRGLFLEGARKNGVDPDRAAHIFELIAKFAGYGFNKPHAAAYALIAYQTAYLKVHHPVEFFAASMSYAMGSAEKLAGFRRELTKRDIRLLPPDVNASDARFTVEDGAVRYALAAIRNVGEAAMRALAQERARGGRFRDVGDFARRLDGSVLNKRQLENLIKAGALDSLHSNRRQLFEGIDAILRTAAAAAERRVSKQDTLFGDAAGPAGLALGDAADWSEAERLRSEYEAIGFYLSAHPLDGQERMLQRLGIVRYADLAQRQAQGVPTVGLKLAGVAIAYRVRNSQKGSRYAVIQMSDPSGMFEVMVFNEVLAQTRDTIDRAVTEAFPILVEADARQSDDEVRLFVRRLAPLDQAIARAPQTLEVMVADAAALAPLARLLEREKGGRGKVRLVVQEMAREEEIEITLKGEFAVSAALRQAIKSLPGVLAVDSA